MANYTSTFTGAENDQYNARIKTLENLETRNFREFMTNRVNISGDTFQGGSLVARSTNILDAVTPSANITGDTGIRFFGSDGGLFGGVRAVSETSGYKGIQVFAYNSVKPKSSGLKLLVNDSGSHQVYVNDSLAWEQGLITLESSSTLSQIFTADSSNVSAITGQNFARWGKVAFIGLSWTNKNAISIPAHGNITNIKIGTIVSGKRPRYETVGFSSGDDAGGASTQIYRIYSSGEIYLAHCEGTGTARTISAGQTNWRIRVMYILP